MTLHLTGPALRFFETSRSLQPARQVNAVVRRQKLEVVDGPSERTLGVPSSRAEVALCRPQRQPQRLERRRPRDGRRGRADDSILTFTEAGKWLSEVGRETQFRNVFRWSLLGPESVRLEHLRFGPDHPVLLFDMTPNAGGVWSSVSPHLCREDCYSAELRQQEAGMSLQWFIAGPKKSESIEYTYS